MKTKHCQWCDHTFETEISYQIYCSAECRDAATKEKIAARYLQTRRSKRKDKDRACKNCSTPLSIYNDHPLCFNCEVDEADVAKALKSIKGLANGKHRKD